MNKQVTDKEENWDVVISPQSQLLDIRLREVWNKKYLLFLFVKRDFVAIYKQTILGPLWFFIQPMLTTLTFTVIFGNIAKISTDGMPKILFYFSGIVIWNYFAECLVKTSGTFISNQNLFGKVYFPRLITPLSIIITNLFKLGIQLLLFLGFWIYYLVTSNVVSPNINILLLPVLILITAALGMGIGMCVSSLTTKYRDLTFLLGFGVQLLMYASPIIYPSSSVPRSLHLLLKLNPMTSIINAFKFGFLGAGTFHLSELIYSGCFAIFILIIGVFVFSKVEKTFIDTV